MWELRALQPPPWILISSLFSNSSMLRCATLSFPLPRFALRAREPEGICFSLGGAGTNT